MLGRSSKAGGEIMKKILSNNDKTGHEKTNIILNSKKHNGGEL